jgi:ribonuclease HII
MTQKELHNQRLLKEAQKAVMQQHTRRHFIKESAISYSIGIASAQEIDDINILQSTYVAMQ